MTRQYLLRGHNPSFVSHLYWPFGRGSTNPLLVPSLQPNSRFTPGNGPDPRKYHLPTTNFQGPEYVSFREG